jgi:hypothetical protein
MVITGIGRDRRTRALRAGTLLPTETAAGRILTPGEHATHLAYGTESWLPVSCVAAQVYAPSGRIVAALAATTFDRAGLGALTEPVRRAAAMISTNLARLHASAS